MADAVRPSTVASTVMAGVPHRHGGRRPAIHALHGEGRGTGVDADLRRHDALCLP